MIINDDCLEAMKKMEDNSISCIVCDPPYFLTNDSGCGFMGKSWDSIHDLSKYLWENSTFVSFVVSFLSSLSLDQGTVEESIALENASIHLVHCKEGASAVAPSAQEFLLSQGAPKKDSAPLLVITKLELWALLKELSPTHIKLIEALETGEKENALYVIPISLLAKEINRIALKRVLPLPKVKDTEAKEIHLTLTDQVRIGNVLEATIGTKLESSFIKETTGNASTASLSAQESKFNAITLSHIEREELMKWLTSLLCAISAIRESKTIPNYLIENFFKVIFSEALRVCKPGSFVLAFSGTRTHHKLASAIENAGWQIRDTIYWCYGAGFPKSHNHFGIEGFGTALKPAVEPCVMAMKPCEGTFKHNAEKWGQAGINIDGCRIPGQDPWIRDTRGQAPITTGEIYNGGYGNILKSGSVKGRWPANILFDEESSEQLDSMTGFEASRFFYCAKTSSRERNEGLEGLPEVKCGMMEDDNYEIKTGSGNLRDTKRKNHHPTVKPLKLMRYLITLVMPPKDGVLLDPFAGSGSTIVAAHQLGLKAIGIEKSADYCEIARKRLEHVEKIKEEPKDLDLFGT